MAAAGSVLPAAGTLTVFSPPSGPGVRVDTYGRAGLSVSPRYDSLLAKVITHVSGSTFGAAVRKARTALSEFSIEGVAANLALLQELLSDNKVQSGIVTTSFFDEKLPDLAAAALSHHAHRVAAVELYPGEEALRAQLAGAVVDVAPEGSEVGAALVRVEGAAYGLIANSSHHLGGAIDAEASDKATDFLALCESFRLPVISLCDTPGFMVGPDAEKEATVRRFGRMFIAGARLTVPLGMIILRKGYGLGAMAMAGGSFHAPEFTIAWPTGEIGGRGLEGAVRLGFRKELAAAADEVERQALFDRLLAAAYQHGKALRSATTFELDDVIDPAESQTWISRLLRVTGTASDARDAAGAARDSARSRVDPS